VSDHDALRPHFPLYFGTCIVERVISNTGDDISGQYHLDCCLILEQLDTGEEEKLYKQSSDFWSPELKAFIEVCRSHSFEIIDASIFHRNDPERFKLIDVETEGGWYE